MRGGDVDRGMAILADVLTIEPRHALALHYLGVAYYLKGQEKNTEDSFKASAAVDATFSDPLFSLGELYEHAGKIEEAKKAYKAATEANQLGHPEAKKALARLSAKGS